MPAQDCDLMAEGEDLEVSLGIRAGAEDDQIEGEAHQPINEREEHETGR